MTMNEDAFFSSDIKKTIRAACLPAHRELAEALDGYRRALSALRRASHLEGASTVFDLSTSQASVGQLKALNEAVAHRYDRLIGSRNAAAVHESGPRLIRKRRFPAPPYLVSVTYRPNKEKRALYSI
ncbi:hypothetical protein ACFSR7_10415 [Cohnella sp. GCM10020058]|uniref:hypothetical protein n=1 Tax=Cohnella sp. GCM10020058 TaxID=3317330 RepID=UPI003639B1EF